MSKVIDVATREWILGGGLPAAKKCLNCQKRGQDAPLFPVNFGSCPECGQEMQIFQFDLLSGEMKQE